jgi:phosphatidylinositol alpha-mannosyltransferase
MKVVVLTTSYPRDADDVAGRFVADAVRAVRTTGVDVDVVSPASFPDFGIAYGGGIAQNLRNSPWKLALVPGFLAAYALAARRAAKDADLVHAHWIPSALAARATGKPYVLQVWGTEVELARRAPALARALLRGAQLVLAASAFLADEARALGAREVRVVPSGVNIPEHVGEPAEPPHVLYVGRLSEEKGILEFLEATEGLPRVIVGDGPLRARVPEAVGFVPPAELPRYYAGCDVFCAPSVERESFGIVLLEAMAAGRAVVAGDNPGYASVVTNGVEGLLVPPKDPQALALALVRVLADGTLRPTMREAGQRTAAQYDWPLLARRILEIYDRAARGAAYAPRQRGIG